MTVVFLYPLELIVRNNIDAVIVCNDLMAAEVIEVREEHDLVGMFVLMGSDAR